MTTFSCPSCGKTIGAEVPAGSAVTCPLCNKVVTVPAGTPGVQGQIAPPMQAQWPGAGNSTRKGLAIASMVLGILGIFTVCLIVPGIVAVILGIVALVKASRRPLEYGGKGFAVAGICLGGVSLLLIPVMAMVIAIMLPSFSKARELAKRSVCAANLAGVGHALAIYANQYKGEYPPDVDSLVVSGLAQPSQFACPSSQEDGSYTKAPITYNAGQPITPAMHEMMHSCYIYIPGQTEKSDPNNVVMYEKKDCHLGEGGNVLFADFHVTWISPYSQVEKLVAETKERLALQRHQEEHEVPEQ